MNAYSFNLANYPWQFFLTLTFKKIEVAACRRLSMVHAVVRQQCKAFGVHYDSVDWVLRTELGEATSRLHFHMLLAGLPLRALTLRNCRALESQWESVRGGMARARLYVGDSEGSAYVLKSDLSQARVDSASFRDSYELNKLDKAGCIVLSRWLPVHLRRIYHGGFAWEVGRYERKRGDSPTPPKDCESSIPIRMLDWQGDNLNRFAALRNGRLSPALSGAVNAVS